MNVQTRLLNNKTNVILVNKPNILTTSVGFYAPIGSVDDEYLKTGTTTLTLRMLLRGTSKYSNSIKLNTALELLGAKVSLETQKEYSSIVLNVPSTNSYSALGILIDIIKNPLFNKSSLNKERSILRKQQKEKDDDPRNSLVRLHSEQLFKGSKYENSTLGNESDLKNISLKDLTSIHSQFFTKDSFLIITADLSRTDSDRLIEPLEKELGSLKLTRRKDLPLIEACKPLEISHKKNILQPVIAVGTYLPGISKGNYYQSFLLNLIIGGMGFSAKAMKIIREKLRLAYFTYSTLSSYSSLSSISVISGVQEASYKKAIMASKQIFDDLASKGVSREDIRIAKGYIQGSLDIQTESGVGLCRFMGTHLIKRHILITPEKMKREFLKIQKSSLDKLTSKKFTTNYHTTVLAKK